LVMLMDCLTEDVLKILRKMPEDAFEDVEENPEIIKEVGERVIQDIINEGDVEKAREVLENVLDKHLSMDSKDLLEQCLEKIETFDVVKEWKL